MHGLPTGVKLNHQELEALEEILCLRPPERRRLRKMIETRGTCAPHGQNIQEWKATATGARVAAVGRFLGTAARGTRKRAMQQELQTEEVAADSSVRVEWYVDEQLRIPTEASAEAIARLTWRGVRDEHGRLYYVHKDPQVASRYEKPVDYTAVWQEIPRNANIPAGDPDLDGTGRFWCDMMSGEVIVGEQPQQEQHVEVERKNHEDETNEDSHKNLEPPQAATPGSLNQTTSEEKGTSVELLEQQREDGGVRHKAQAPALLQGQNTGGEHTESYHAWTEHEDEASGQPWWRNDETGDETWVRPF